MFPLLTARVVALDPSQSPAITISPASQVTNENASMSLCSVATGTPPLSFQWLKNSTKLSGATQSTLTFTNLRMSNAASYSVLVTNDFGSVTSAPAVLTVLSATSALALAQALDITNLIWATNQSATWFWQPGVTHDGIDAVQSGSIGDSKSSSMQATITGPGSLSFWWKVSSETNKDLLLFYVGGTEQARISGEVNWQRRTFSIPSGSQVLKWTYTKNSSTSKGQDRGWVDTVKFIHNDSLPEPIDISEAIQRVNDHFIATTTFQSNGWARGVYQTGNMRAYDVLHIDSYRQWAEQWGTYFQWQGGFRGATNADGEVCGQTYFDLYQIDPQPIRIAAVQAGIDSRVRATAIDDWWWIDAFYMAGPVYARFSKLYATNSYLDKMWLFYQDMKVRRGLFDPTYSLWYRDETVKTATTEHDQKQFWGRGEGWVIAALARVLEQMPADHPYRGEFTTMLQTMAAALKPLQGADGMWRSSLLDPTEFPNPETSSTALFTFALAWGIRHGCLDDAVYRPVMARAWNGMMATALHPDGIVGYVQPQGRVPDSATYDSFSDHGTGAFLLAGSEMYALAQQLPVTMTPLRLFTSGNSKVVLTWTAAPGKTYHVFYKDTLSDPTWIAFGVMPTGSVIQIEDVTVQHSQRFYRVLEE